MRWIWEGSLSNQQVPSLASCGSSRAIVGKEDGLPGRSVFWSQLCYFYHFLTTVTAGHWTSVHWSIQWNNNVHRRMCWVSGCENDTSMRDSTVALECPVKEAKWYSTVTLMFRTGSSQDFYKSVLLWILTNFKPILRWPPFEAFSNLLRVLLLLDALWGVGGGKEGRIWCGVGEEELGLSSSTPPLLRDQSACRAAVQVTLPLICLIHCRLPRGLNGKESACQCRRCRRLGFDPWVRKIPWRRIWQPTPLFLLWRQGRCHSHSHSHECFIGLGYRTQQGAGLQLRDWIRQHPCRGRGHLSGKQEVAPWGPVLMAWPLRMALGFLRTVGRLHAWLPRILGLEFETQGTHRVGHLRGEIVNGKDKHWKIRHWPMDSPLGRGNLSRAHGKTITGAGWATPSQQSRRGQP